jgi:hypothetical protein
VFLQPEMCYTQSIRPTSPPLTASSLPTRSIGISAALQQSPLTAYGLYPDLAFVGWRQGWERPSDPEPPRGRLLAWTDDFVRYPKITVSQQGRVVETKRLPWPASPGRVLRIPASVLSQVTPAGDRLPSA